MLRTLTLIAALVAPSLAAADKLALSQISTYLNGLKSAQSDFTQINDDGSLSTGRFYIKRPGRARFEYDGKDAAKVIAGQGSVVIFDPKSNQPPETYPLKRTPLSIILADTVDLGRARMVVAHDYDGTSTRITAQDPDNPDYGSIDLMFTADPVELRKWVIRDSSGGQTTVILGNMDTGLSLANVLFNTVSPGPVSDR